MEERTPHRPGVGVLACLLVAGLLGCVGPTTPLGAVDRSTEGGVAPPSTPPTAEPPPGEPARIIFSPSFQQVHGPYTWRVLVVDPAVERPQPGNLRVFYDGLEVTEAARFQFRATYRPAEEGSAEALLLEMPHLRLGPLEDHEILVEYAPAAGQALRVAYPFPEVDDLEADEPIASTDPFPVGPKVLGAVVGASRRYRLNPVLLAALIAQESSFDPYALSKANALGLTQVTHLAEADIALAFPRWPRYRGIQHFSRRKLRRLIPKTINGRNEWRLDPVKSVWGGAYYLAYLRDRLVDEANRSTVALAGGPWENVLTEACLASYNSGLNRILYTIQKNHEHWLDQPGIREAKRYVRKILSYYGAFRHGVDLPGEAGGEET